MAPILVSLLFLKEWNSDGKIRFPLYKANGKSLGKGWYPAFSPTAVQSAFCSHCSFTLRSGGKRPKETSMTQVGLPWCQKGTAKWSSMEMGNLVPRHSGFEWGLKDSKLRHGEMSLCSTSNLAKARAVKPKSKPAWFLFEATSPQLKSQIFRVTTRAH